MNIILLKCIIQIYVYKKSLKAKTGKKTQKILNKQIKTEHHFH